MRQIEDARGGGFRASACRGLQIPFRCQVRLIRNKTAIPRETACSRRRLARYYVENGLVLNPETIYQNLLSRERALLTALPRTHGIYALFDHAGAMRYIGITPGDRDGFYGRINKRHVAGSEHRSHKFSHAYNTGRMWRDRRDSGPDAMLAKKLRSRFVRCYCRATVLPVDRDLHEELPALEVAVQAFAPAGQLLWQAKRGFEPYAEPEELVDRLLTALAFATEERAAVDRQKTRSLERTPATPPH